MNNSGKDTLIFEFMGVGNTIHNSKMKVPIYQRSYSWDEKQVSDLFNDIVSAVAHGSKIYFIGTIVTTRSNGDLEIIDGQQRLATVDLPPKFC